MRKTDISIAAKEVMKFVDYSLPILTQVGDLYRKAGIHFKHKIIGSIFPEKLVFDGQKYRNTRLNEVLHILTAKFKAFGKG